MSETIETFIGQQVRRIREQHGLSLRALSEKAYLSSNAISLIERGENSPTISSLQRLANALEVPITAFFEEEVEQPVVFVRNNQGRRYRGNGIVMESIGTGLLNQQLDALSITIAPGAGNMHDPIHHLGEEFVRCLEGQVEYYVSDQIFKMSAGDSLHFDATQSHSFRNTTHISATILTIFRAGEEQQLALQRHMEILRRRY
jgi:transcriptional regulator with XRE-family HTH domain